MQCTRKYPEWKRRSWNQDCSRASRTSSSIRWPRPFCAWRPSAGSATAANAMMHSSTCSRWSLLRVFAVNGALSVVLMACVSAAQAASVGPKNKEGNRLFGQGKYEEAQKAYLEAQAEAPDRPELLYNLGNTLIKQKRYEQALQALRQAISRGDKGLQASGWFNMGNALFEAGNFGDSAQSYIQSLRLNPADRDAKHNLELALKKKEEQQNPKQDQDKNSPKTGSGQSPRGERDPQKPPPEKGSPPPQSSQGKQDSPKAVNPQSTQAERREESFSKERALQILDALQNQEIAEQRKLLERRARRKATGKDW
ncbi:MAG: hypothetical protein DMG10_21435 [Acidobacteria bacterium]|nr:MAG: hypothetical protein DMG10_21435 [Acidobacteriota bacterium]